MLLQADRYPTRGEPGGVWGGGAPPGNAPPRHPPGGGGGGQRPGFQPAAPAPQRLSLPPTPQKSVPEISGADLEPISAGYECYPMPIIR